MHLQVVTFAQGLCSYLEFIQREYSSYSFSRAPKQFSLFDVIILLVTCMLLRVRRLNLLNNLAISYLQSVSFIVRSPSANYVCQSCYLLVFPSTKSLSLRIRTQIGSRVLQIQVTFENVRYVTVVYATTEITRQLLLGGKDELPLGKVKVQHYVGQF